jgi:hypothetical protein
MAMSAKGFSTRRRLVLVGADELNLGNPAAMLSGNTPPGVAGFLERVDAFDDR